MAIRTFFIQTLGCRVNQYESDQLAALLRGRGLLPSDDPRGADLRIINTCSVTVQAAARSRQATRDAARGNRRRQLSLPQLPDDLPLPQPSPETAFVFPDAGGAVPRPRVIVTGCWATSDARAAAALPGVDAVVTHHDDVAAELARLLRDWQADDGSDHSAGKAGPRCATVTLGSTAPGDVAGAREADAAEVAPKPLRNDGWIDQKAGSSAGDLDTVSKPAGAAKVNRNSRARGGEPTPDSTARGAPGTTSLPLLGERQTGRQRAYLKVQDGCDAHCTYCIIPSLRPRLWSKPVEHAVEEARRLVDAGHVELVLTGIFLGAYGHSTALRRRQLRRAGDAEPVARLIEALCTRVPGLRRLRLSSLEPGDLTEELVSVLRSHPQVVPHFHLPLQSGSDPILRRMNRQYTRDDFFRLADRVRAAFDRPALTTDVIVAFPGETDDEFRRTVEAVDHAGFIHVHAFSFSPRPGTAAARWTRDFVRGPVVNERVALLRARAEEHSLAFRGQFVGETVELLVERGDDANGGGLRHGRCERYFPVHFDAPLVRPGDLVRVRVDHALRDRTTATLLGTCP